MKNLIAFGALLVLTASCTLYDVEPRFDSRDKFVGYYDVEEYSETYHETTFYEMHISRSRHRNEVYIDNFYAANIRIYATVDFNDIRIPFQIVDGYEIEGSGTLYHDELNLNYRVKDIYDHAIADYCQTVAWR